ncbi:hypothetical protein IC235_14595 [Hymenobacter sp. BT664]|uniref:Uncharacterized protein n=1 Tax=Hymenobacter montanus TaxID=2771359 RepID=A0A927GK56_9BACT|nr:hypothetical protein [Hymenobacter montanus]MBD2769120.1 hypothetical protein [Hymenobacter montanus]
MLLTLLSTGGIVQYHGGRAQGGGRHQGVVVFDDVEEIQPAQRRGGWPVEVAGKRLKPSLSRDQRGQRFAGRA